MLARRGLLGCLAIALSAVSGLLALPFDRAAAAGGLDPGFGNRGVFVFPRSSTPGEEAWGQDMAIGPEDAVFVLRSATSCQNGGCTAKLLVHKLLAGIPDAGFGAAGAIEVPIGSTGSRYPGSSSLAISPEGKPVVAAHVEGDVVVLRFNRDGSRDPGFGAGGQTRLDLGGIETDPEVAVQPGGGVVVAADSRRGPKRHRVPVLARLTVSGQPDLGFGRGTGEVRGPGRLDIRGGFALGGFAVSGSGQIALAGPHCCVGTDSLFVSRRSPAGRLLGGLVAEQPWGRLRMGRQASVNSLVPLAGGRLYVVGRRRSGLFAIRLLSNGRRDPGYGRRGVARIGRLGFVYDDAPAAADRSGRLLVAGNIPSSEDYDPGEGSVTRRTRSGQPDRRWGRGGYAHLAFGPNAPLAIGLLSTGRVVVFGSNQSECIRSCAAPGLAVAQLLGG